MMGLTVTDPVAIGPDQLVYTDVEDDDLPAWDEAHPYVIENRVIFNNAIYQAAMTTDTGNQPNVGKQPDQNVGSWWLYVSPTNIWRAFDASHSTASSRAGGFVYEIKPGRAVGAIHITDLTDCASLRVEMIDPVAGTVYDTGEVAVGSIITRASWWEWLFGPRVPAEHRHWYDLPLYPGAKLRITVEGGPKCAIGTIMVGQLMRFGLGVETGLRTPFHDYSRVVTDDWGETTIQRRGYVDEVSFSLFCKNRTDFDPLNRFVRRRRSTIMFWNVLSRYEATQIMGFASDVVPTMDYSEYSTAAFTITGVQMT
jgi:hypothetical protein